MLRQKTFRFDMSLITEEFISIEEVARKMRADLCSVSDKKKIGILYAFNGTGKTRLSSFFDDESGTCLSYNAFFEDLFVWDNANCIFQVESDSRIIRFIIDQGLEGQITDYFQKLIGSKIFPSYDFVGGEVTFNFSPGDERSEDNIKISRGEESLFIWSVFYTVLQNVLLALGTKEDDRETDQFNNLELIVIDDPVSSIDDTGIITLAVDLIDTIRSFESSSIKFLITTHHPLLFNVLFNGFSRVKDCKEKSWILLRSGANLKLKEQDDSPFGYHHVIRETITEAIALNSLDRYHFNLFRGLLEKTANFLGYRNYTDCLEGQNKESINRLINLYSHGKLSELESKHFPDTHQVLFVEAYNDFLERFRWKT